MPAVGVVLALLCLTQAAAARFLSAGAAPAFLAALAAVVYLVRRALGRRGKDWLNFYIVSALLSIAFIVGGYTSPSKIAGLVAIAPRGEGGHCRFNAEADCRIEAAPKRPMAGELRFDCVGQVSSSADLLIVTGRLLVSAPDLPWRRSSSASAGDSVLLRGSFSPVVCGSGIFPGPFDYSSYLLRRGYLGQLNVKREADLLMLGQWVGRGAGHFLTLLAAKRSAKNLNAESVGVLFAAVLGSRDLLSEDAADIFRRTGTTHLLVVSGFHVGVVFLLVHLLFSALWNRSRRLLVRIPREPLSVICGLAAIISYCNLLGGDQTIVRSAIVVGLFGAARCLARKPDPAEILLVSLLLAVIAWPESFFEPGLQLTAAACFALLNAGRRIERTARSESHGVISRYVAATALTSSYAALYTAPVVLCWFGGVAPLSPLINIVAIPVFGLGCIGAGAAAFALLYLGAPGADTVLLLASGASEMFIRFLGWVVELTDGTVLGYLELSTSSARLLALVLTVVLIAIEKRSRRTAVALAEAADRVD